MKKKIFSTIHENSTKNGKPNNQKIYPQPDFHSAWRHINNKLMSLVVYEDMKAVNIAKKIINRLNHYRNTVLINFTASKNHQRHHFTELSNFVGWYQY